MFPDIESFLPMGALADSLESGATRRKKSNESASSWNGRGFHSLAVTTGGKSLSSQ
jgi:hypothetical protein